MPVSCHFQGCKALRRIVKRRYIKYHAFAFAFAFGCTIISWCQLAVSSDAVQFAILQFYSLQVPQRAQTSSKHAVVSQILISVYIYTGR